MIITRALPFIFAKVNQWEENDERSVLFVWKRFFCDVSTLISRNHCDIEILAVALVYSADIPWLTSPQPLSARYYCHCFLWSSTSMVTAIAPLLSLFFLRKRCRCSLELQPSRYYLNYFEITCMCWIRRWKPGSDVYFNTQRNRIISFLPLTRIKPKNTAKFY